MTDERIYLDHAATTPVRPEVLEAMLPYFTQSGYNPSSLHAEGRRARAALDEARDRVAGLLGAQRKEIVFTGSGSEADNLAIFGVARARGGRGARGGHLLSTAIEHPAVLRALDALRDEGWAVSLLAVDRDGLVDPAAFAAALRPDTVLASVMYANNEIGTVEPVARLAAIARERGVLFHTDAIQAAAYLPLDVAALGVDLLSLSAHKFYGPKGVGALYVRDGTPLQPMIGGGGQEFGRRAGTENVAGIVGFATALSMAAGERDAASVRVAGLRNRLERAILASVEGAWINGGGAARLPGTSSASIRDVDGEQLLVRLDLEGIAVSGGSACASGALEPSHVIAALSGEPRGRFGTVRFSLGRSTTAEEIDRLIALLPGIVAELRAFSVVPK
ncbi:MAG: cysteine desulfurase family protein [Vulcanimicrobiaceae bacterium]